MNLLSYEEIIELLKPKIKNALRETSYQEQEELEQEIKIKIFKQIDKLNIQDIPDFFEILSRENNI